jgi:two-component sensor histidine kinase
VIVAAHLWQPLMMPGGFAEVWHQDLHSLTELVHLRSRLRAELTGNAAVVDPTREHWSERMVLVVDELASNALRHGAPPASATLSRSGNEWMIAVSDSAGDTPPRPAEGRDPGLGGFGLYLVADLAQRHGWCAAGERKVLWALLTADDPAS